MELKKTLESFINSFHKDGTTLIPKPKERKLQINYGYITENISKGSSLSIC